MAGFLRKFATNSKKNAGVERNVISPVNHNTLSSKPASDDSPPSLPPLFARFATSTLAEPDPISLFPSYISSPIPPIPKLDDNILPSGEWDAWKALIDPPLVSTPDPPHLDPPPVLLPKPKKQSSSPPLPVTRRKYTGPGLPNKLFHGNTSPDVTLHSRLSTSPDPSPRPVHAASTRQDRDQQHLNSATPPTATTFRDSAVVLPSLSPKKPTRLLSPEQDLITNPRGSPHPSSPSLSDNQVPSYTPLNSRHSPPASQHPPSLLGLQTVAPLQKKPASTSSHTSSTTQSSANHSHVTRAGSVSTAFTSASSIAPAIKLIDVTNSGVETHPGRSSSGLRLAQPNPFSPRSSTPGSTLNNANTTSSIVGLSHTYRALPTSSSPPATEPPSRNLTHSTMSVTTTTTTTRSQVVPPSSMPPRQNTHPLTARPLTHADNTLQHHRTTLLESVHSRGISLELSTPPVRKGPLIFAAIASDISPPDNSPIVGLSANTNANMDIDSRASVSASPARRAADHDDHDETRAHARGYPSPPAEYLSLNQTGTRRVPSLSSSGHGHVHGYGHGRVSSSGHGHEQRHSSFETGHMSLSEATVPPARKTSRAGSTVRTMTATTTVPETQNSKTRTLTKARSRSRPPTPASSTSHAPRLPVQELSSEALFSEDALFFDADPFAKVEGVQVVKTHAVSCEDEPVPTIPLTPPTRPKSPLTPESPENYKTARTQRRGQWLEKMRPPVAADAVVQQEVMNKEAEFLQREEEARVRMEEEKRLKEEEERRVKEEALRLEEEERRLEEQRLKEEEEERLRREATVYPIVKHISDASLLPHLLTYLTFSDWCSLYGATKEIRGLFENRTLREYVLEHFLGTVAYSRWKFEWAEPLALSLKDLNDYMRGVSMPTYQYGQLAEAYLQPRIKNPGDAISEVPDILALAKTTRAYTRVVMRLRAQAESEARAVARAHVSPVGSMSRSSSRAGTRDKHAVVLSRVSSRAPSPASSSANSHGRPSTSSSSRTTFRSPLVKLHRAPLLRVFVPSPEGEWLSDSSVVECEAELKRAGVLKLLRVGDVVWDVAVGDEGNLGRMVWDGSYLVDLDYKYSRMGELSPYFHSLAFSPSYFHRVIRTGVNAAMNPDGNPIVYLDVSPWGKELATNLQLLQDRATTTTPHGALHSVVRWVHRSSFTIRPPVSPHHPHAYSHMQNLRLPIPHVDGFFIDPGWYGTVVIESEGTNEGLADFQDRCGPGAFPPRAHTVTSKMRNEEKDSRRVFRVLREKSRPGEIWIRAVREKERVM